MLNCLAARATLPRVCVEWTDPLGRRPPGPGHRAPGVLDDGGRDRPVDEVVEWAQRAVREDEQGVVA